MTPTKTDLITGSVVNEANGFNIAVANSASAQDHASFVDTVGSNTYVGTRGYSYLVNGATRAFQETIGYAFVYAVAPAGGHDVALARPQRRRRRELRRPAHSGTLSANGTLFNEVVGFPSVTATDSGGGADTASLLDTAGLPAQGCQAAPTGSYLLGQGYVLQARASRRCRFTPRRERATPARSRTVPAAALSWATAAPQSCSPSSRRSASGSTTSPA